MPAKDQAAYSRKRRQDPTYNARQTEYVRRWKWANRYGITPEQYDEMLQVQGGGCGICGKTPEENGKFLSVDHDHETDEVRGLLCQPCNLALGLLEERIEEARAYLRGGE